MTLDAPRRTLLAWYGLTVNPVFHAWWCYAATGNRPTVVPCPNNLSDTKVIK